MQCMEWMAPEWMEPEWETIGSANRAVAGGRGVRSPQCLTELESVTKITLPTQSVLETAAATTVAALLLHAFSLHKGF